MVTVSEDNFREFATIQNSFYDVCYDCVHMHVGVYMDTHVCVCAYVHYTMHVHMHVCMSTPCVFVHTSWLYVFFPTPPRHTLGKKEYTSLFM